jgi:hypothetical protein
MAYLCGGQQEKLTRKNSSVTDVNQTHMYTRLLTQNTFEIMLCSADLKPQDNLNVGVLLSP